MTATSKINQLRQVDAEIIEHVIARGKLWEKRRRLVQIIGECPELTDYQNELKEWLDEMTTQSKGGSE